MSQKDLQQLGDTELEVMNIVWRKGKATVNDVRDEILQKREVAYTTIMTVMKNLAEKGFLEYEQKGRRYEYQPTKSADSVKAKLLDRFINSVFRGSAEDLVKTLVDKKELSEQEKRKILSHIRKYEEG